MNDYQYAALRMAIYPDAGSGSDLALTYVALGLGEAGEVQGKIKKLLRDGDTPALRAAAAAELGDLLWYVAAVASELGIPLSQIARNNLHKLRSRQDRGVLGGSGDDR